MRITADTNVLVRALVADDPVQARLAQDTLDDATRIAIPTVALCELVWVLSRGYRLADADISRAIRSLMDSANVDADRPAVEAGLALLDQGGDFADGVIAHDGASLGAEAFVSFDKDAVKRMERAGLTARLLG